MYMYVNFSMQVHYRSRAASDSLLPSYPQAKPPVQGVHSLLSPVIGPRSGQTSSMPPYHSCTVINPSTQVVAPAPATQLSYPPYHTYCPTAVHIAGTEERRVAVSSPSTGCKSFAASPRKERDIHILHTWNILCQSHQCTDARGALCTKSRVNHDNN